MKESAWGKQIKCENKWEESCQSPSTTNLSGAAEVIVVHLFYRLEVDHSLQLGLMFVCGREDNMGLVQDFNTLATTGFTWVSPRITALKEGRNQTLIMTNLWLPMMDGKWQAQHFFPVFSNRWSSHCIFRLACILTLLWYIIAVCFISHCRTAVRNRWGTQQPSLPPGTNTPQANLKSSR